AVCTALGASRGRVVRQLATESVLLALAGGALGVVVARLGIDALLALAPDGLPRASEIALDGRVLGFTCLLAIGTGLAFGLVPALQTSRIRLGEALKEGRRTASDGRRHQRLRGALVVGQVAVALVLLVAAGLLIRSFSLLQQVHPGF